MIIKTYNPTVAYLPKYTGADRARISGVPGENVFVDEDEIESADATISYDEETEQHSIEFSLKTNGKVDREKIEVYKTYLSKTYADVILIIDGETM